MAQYKHYIVSAQSGRWRSFPKASTRYSAGWMTPTSSCAAAASKVSDSQRPTTLASHRASRRPWTTLTRKTAERRL